MGFWATCLGSHPGHTGGTQVVCLDSKCTCSMFHHYHEVIMGAMASQITSPTIVLLNRLFGRGSKKTAKLRVTGLCVGNSPVTGEFPAQRASNEENVFIRWRHHAIRLSELKCAHVIWFKSDPLVAFTSQAQRNVKAARGSDLNWINFCSEWCIGIWKMCIVGFMRFHKSYTYVGNIYIKKYICADLC